MSELSKVRSVCATGLVKDLSPSLQRDFSVLNSSRAELENISLVGYIYTLAC